MAFEHNNDLVFKTKYLWGSRFNATEPEIQIQDLQKKTDVNQSEFSRRAICYS